MPDGIAMEDRVAALESRLAAVEQRLNALEGAQADVLASEERAPGADNREGFVSQASTLIGSVLLIFGGAYLLRAITDLNVVPTAFGILLGASYALLWLFVAHRKAGNEDERASAMFYGGASIFLALPLLVEANTRFELLSGQQTVVALALFCALAMLVAVTRNLRSLGWLVTAGGIVTAFVVLNASRAAVAVPAFLIILGLGSLWAVYVRQWIGPQWLGALGANTGVVVLLLISTSDQWSTEPLTPFLLGAALLVTYLVSFALRSHVRGQNVGIFETLQALLAVGIVFWAASVAAQAGQLALATVGAWVVVIGACAYGLAFTPETRSARGRNFYFHSALGLALVVAGTALAMSPAIAAAAWSLMALAMAWFSGRFGRVALSLQCTFLLLAAGVGSGILTTGLEALAGDASALWPPFVPWHLIIALTTVACLFIPVAQHSDRWGVLSGAPQLIVLALSVWEVGGLMVVYLAPALAGVGGADANPAILAALRTAVLSAASVTLALSSRFKRWPEARWLVYPVLLVVGVKLLLEDFPNGQPATLFVALAVVGGALLLVAKLLSRDKIGA
ncbi:MAG: DUF2339 domain-containing protein [Gammaproteobacteria bacterium]|nr:DUF2339 domain-containing protein [Gammaproteobacteria bacterium]MDH3372061.1 DUF2339 domain-containing protein [Gammaproteobacteria bacterium]MDH3407858.1 DUF2339 domain-containing protein [Gammaproteobacteria bacterium]MDH3551516.1 DUF2339 domain-containing protein [Gammaproteobacteria bacterium]